MEKITSLSLDLETYSDVDLKKSGVYRYAESPNFEILLFAYSVDNGPVIVIDIAQGECVPDDILAALSDETITKWAYNASFERVCLSYWLKRNYPEHFYSYSIPGDTVSNYLDPASWKCSRIWGAYMGLPLSLEGIGAVLKLSNQKMKEGKDLIKYFCTPCKATKVNGGRTRNLPKHDLEKWATFKSYNKRDVEVELAIKERLSKYPVPDFIWEEYHLDQEINDRGIGVDMQLVANAIGIDAKTKQALLQQMQKKTGLENPNSVQQMKTWLSERGIETESLDKKAVKGLLPDVDKDVAEVLSCRQQLAKSSVSKYTAMSNMVCADSRARGCFMFYGANRSGRWAGRGIQLQNLPQNHMDDLEEARNLVRGGNFNALELLYDNVPEVLSELIRTAFVPKPGYKYIVSDFSAIEARVLSFLAVEQWRMEVFANNGDIYCQAAEKMFHVPVEKHGANSHLRQKGKMAELASIAEGELVLTDKGLVPIEHITTEHQLWDGEHWVRHQGLIYKGEREVIEYEGLRATADHLVWIEGKPEPIPFGIAASCGAHLIQTGNGRHEIRLGKHHISRKTLEQCNESLLCTDRMQWMPFYPMAKLRELATRCIQRLSALHTPTQNSPMARSAFDRSKATLRKSKGQRIPQLWGTWYSFQLFQRNSGRTIYDTRIWPSRKRNGNRPNRYKQQLSARKFKICIALGKLHKSAAYCAVGIRAAVLALCKKCRNTKVITGIEPGRYYWGCRKSSIRETEELAHHQCKTRLYDIQNAGTHHRFTVSGKLVHNCGYGGSVGALKAMGALDMGLTESELQPLVDAWRTSNQCITNFWWAIDAAVKQAVIYKTSTETHGFHIYYQGGMLFIDLPSGRRLCYVKPRMGVNQFGSDSVTYEGINTGKWTRIESYGPKFVENIVQAVSRDILAYAMKGLRFCQIVGHVHDEMIIECSPNVSLDAICKQMGRTPPWIKGLLLRADGYECNFYKKD